MKRLRRFLATSVVLLQGVLTRVENELPERMFGVSRLGDGNTRQPRSFGSARRGYVRWRARNGRLIMDKARGWAEYRPSKTAMFWACVGCVVATLVIGFTWGGWVTGGTAQAMAADAASTAKAELVAAACVDRFMASPDAKAQLATLKKTSSWERDEYLEKGGWLSVVKGNKPVDGAADICAERLMKAELPSADSGKSG
jgi:hypothetical protein